MDKALPSLAEPTPETSAEPSFSTFNRALEGYLGSLPKDKKRSKFIELCRTSGTTVTPQAINELLQHEQARGALSGPLQRIFRQVMSALRDYSDVISQLVSAAHPIPCAIIWGALKVVVESSNRCDSMFESMKNELQSLAEYLRHITVYEHLYGDSKEMQRLFFNSYTNIIHFWYRVHKECKQNSLARLGRAMTSSALTKMNSIISDIRTVADNIAVQASLCQGQKDRQEYTEALAERKLQNEWRKRQSYSNYFGLCEQIRTHLSPKDDIVRPNSYRHELNLRYLQPETCQWLIRETCYTTWWAQRSAADRLFCLSGPPGYGKSTLTSFAIRDLESRPQGTAVAYYFCQFSQPCKYSTEILCLFALQLFNAYFERHLPIDEEFGHYILQSRKEEHLKHLIDDLVLRLLDEGVGVYFFIDGLDETPMHINISPVLEFLTNLRKTREVCLWVSKRRQARVVECFEKYIQPDLHLTLELADHTEADVVRFLRAKMHALKQRFCSQQGDLGETDRELFRLAEGYLILHAKGHFLWARLMTDDFEGDDRVEDVKELLEHILGGTPKKLVDLYKSYFDRFERRLDRDNQRVAIKVMSLVAFARRQLRLEELQAAAAILASYGKKKKAASDAARSISTMPLKTFLAKYTTLVEVDGNASDPTPTDRCRLLHSSVLEFLDQNPATLDKDSKDHQLHISRFAIANACLIHLAHPVYTKVLQKQTLPDGTYTWVDSTGATVDKQVFSQYAAKYWVRHLQDLEKKDQDQIRGRVVDFVSSNKFQTCMQIQSIWVQGRFDAYYVNNQLSLLRAIPEWLIRSRSSDSKRLTITKYWSDYGELMHDWRMLLSCGECHDSYPDCSYLTFRGEVDRIWWTTFGPDHLFSDFRSRYLSFRLSEGKNTWSERFEALSVSREQIVIVRLGNWNRAEGSLQFVCEHWTLSDHVSAPTLGKKQVIMTTEVATNWLLYVKSRASEGPVLAKPTALSGNAQILRLGAQLFRKDEDDEYRVASGGDVPAYFEEVSGRGALVVIGSRSHALAAQLQEPYRLFERLGEDFARLERLGNASDTDDVDSCTTSDESDDEWLSEASSDSSDNIEIEAYESWSEGSTDVEGYVSSDSSSETEVSEQANSDMGSEAEPEEDLMSGSSSGESEAEAESDTPSTLPLSAFPTLGGSHDSDAEEELWSMEVDARLNALSQGLDIRSPNAREPTVLLTALQYDDNSTPTKLFEYSYPLRFMLYDSPPAVHPQEPLVVWPLGGGDLLFADVAAKTYFTRRLRPSASHTRQVSVKPQFSPCGHFLHVASLEIRVSEVKGEQRCKNRDCSVCHPPPDLHFYMLVLTYRLSTRKPTRSPPILLHRVKVDLGKHEGQSQLPFALTWTPRDLFISRRGTNLQVFRVQLFSGCVSDGCPLGQILVPMKKTLLPDSAALRDVYFIPLSDDHNGASMVVVGSETRVKAALVEDLVQLELPDGTSELQNKRTLAPSIGAILQAEDIGGWIRTEGIPLPKGRSMGNLDMRKEKFDPVDDCDAEPYSEFL